VFPGRTVVGMSALGDGPSAFLKGFLFLRLAIRTRFRGGGEHFWVKKKCVYSVFRCTDRSERVTWLLILRRVDCHAGISAPLPCGLSETLLKATNLTRSFCLGKLFKRVLALEWNLTYDGDIRQS
jgi:hypothetical protein